MLEHWYQLCLFSVLTTLICVHCEHHRCTSGYDRWQYLDGQSQNYLLCWKVDWSDKTIIFMTKVATTGWVGLGFSPTGFMPNSDVVIGWVKNGDGYLSVRIAFEFASNYSRMVCPGLQLQDRFAVSHTLPSIDDIQNVELISSNETDGWTTLEFKRKLTSCDPKDRSIEVTVHAVFMCWVHES